MLPATVVPEVLLGRASHPAFEGGRIVSDDTLDVGLEIARRRRIDRLEGETKASARLPDRGPEDDELELLEPAAKHG